MLLGPVVPPSRWAATSNVEVVQTTYFVNGSMIVKEEIEREREREREWR